ncbi:hypothetical protein [Cyanobium sp. ATX-6F1]|uniref:hypothetical protein n=1 Tax=Cyanobium sp. ATX-6F1 TaxID=3137388 RepID=UPI0039BE1C4A
MSANRRWEPPPEGIAARLGLGEFRQRAPWWGADLQTLRDSLRQPTLQPEHGEPFELPIGGGDRLLALLDRPATAPRALVLLTPGLGGCSEGQGVGRLALSLQGAGLAVVRLNLRGAGRGRPLARGTYAAQVNRDLAPVLVWARQLASRLGPSPPVRCRCWGRVSPWAEPCCSMPCWIRSCGPNPLPPPSLCSMAW